MKSLRTQAIVLRRTNYGEADRIINVITPDHGRLSVMAKGVRREKSKLAGGVELFAISDISVVSGKGDIWTLTGASMNTFFAQIMTDYERMQFGYEAIKQVARATEQLDDGAFYELLRIALESLNNTDISLDITVSWFWLQLATLLGTGLNLATDANGMKLVEDTNYRFDVDEMAFVFYENGEFTTEHIKMLRLLAAHHPVVSSRVRHANGLFGQIRWLCERIVSR